MNNVIKFYSSAGTYHEFSNFHPAPIVVDEKTWPTTEHFFQAQKFGDDSTYQEMIRAAVTPSLAKKFGGSRNKLMRPDWDDIKEDVMRTALLAKFTQHPALKALLLSTRGLTLQEDAPNDFYWGVGRDGSGKNRLGVLLMELRDKL